jgi:hypothetical protein
MRVIIKTQSNAWEVVEHEGMPADAPNALVYVRQVIDASEPLKCRVAHGDASERWVTFYPAGLEYVAAET